MVDDLLRTLLKVAVASLIAGSIMNHLGITAEVLMKAAGLTPEQAVELVRRGIDWALPNLALGALVIVPIWFLVFLFRPSSLRRQ
jgi:hypothetical protein